MGRGFLWLPGEWKEGGAGRMKNQDAIIFVQEVVMVGRRRTVWGGDADGLCTSLE